MPWFDYRPHDVSATVQYSSEQTAENRRFLERLLGAGFLKRVRQKARDHDLVTHWLSASAFSHLEMNGLADDLRLLEHLPSLMTVLPDLRSSDFSLPTWHAIHIAAMFERAASGTVSRFLDYERASESRADFAVVLGGGEVPVEAKLSMRSELETGFINIARSIAKKITSLKLLRKNSQTIIVLKPGWNEWPHSKLVEHCVGALRGFPADRIRARSSWINVFIEPPPTSIVGLTSYEGYWILAPIPDAETLRVLDRAKKASTQLRLSDLSRKSGILAVGLSQKQSASEVVAHVGRRIKGGNLSGIAALVLNRRRIETERPPYRNLDFLMVERNARATHPLTTELKLVGPGRTAAFIDWHDEVGGIPAYQEMGASVTVARGSSPTFKVAPTIQLKLEMLE